MLSFKQYITEAGVPFVGWKSSFSEQRDEDNVEFISWGSSFGDQRNANLKQKLKLPPSRRPLREEWKTDQPLSKRRANVYDATYDADVHDHPDIKPAGLTPEHEQAIEEYTNMHQAKHSSSSHMNNYLRNRAGEKDKYFGKAHTEEAVKGAIKRLSSAFTPENTNRRPVEVYTGVPEHIGNKFANSEPGSKRALAGFTSASTSRRTAHDFATGYNGYRNNEAHILHMKLMPGAGLSAVHHSEASEDEFILHHGAHVVYHGSEHHPNADGTTTHVHKITVYPSHKPLEKYGEYTPKQD